MKRDLAELFKKYDMQKVASKMLKTFSESTPEELGRKLVFDNKKRRMARLSDLEIIKLRNAI